jgi:hypothetical protein
MVARFAFVFVFILLDLAEALRWSLNTIADVKCRIKSGSISCYSSLPFFITIISASCRGFLLLIKSKLINGLPLLTWHRIELDSLWWTAKGSRSVTHPPVCVCVQKFEYVLVDGR